MGQPVVHFEIMGNDQVTEDVEIGTFSDPEGHAVGVHQGSVVGRPSVSRRFADFVALCAEVRGTP